MYSYWNRYIYIYTYIDTDIEIDIDVIFCTSFVRSGLRLTFFHFTAASSGQVPATVAGTATRHENDYVILLYNYAVQEWLGMNVANIVERWTCKAHQESSRHIIALRTEATNPI